MAKFTEVKEIFINHGDTIPKTEQAALEAQAQEGVEAPQRRISGYKAIVDAARPEVVFNVCKNTYTVTQHDAVVDNLNAALENLKLETVGEPQEFSGGARLHIVKRFPTIGLDMEGEYYNLTITIDNSYDSTTSLRVEVGAMRDGVQFYLYDRFVNVGRKHTKHIDVEMVKRNVLKGINRFETKVKDEFERMRNTPVNFLDASMVFDKLAQAKPRKKSDDAPIIEITDDADLSMDDAEELDKDGERKSIIPQKYAEEIKKAIDELKPATQWRLYRLVMDVMAKQDIKGVERRRQVTREIVKVIRTLK